MNFALGSRVRTKARAGGHTRLPHYLAQKPGVIEAYLGSFPLPDAVVRDRAHAAAADLFTVAFRRSDVFGGSTDDVIYADLFDAYLELQP